jgi:hypothetical protein
MERQRGNLADHWRRVTAQANASIIVGFGVLAPVASGLKAWQTALDPPLGWWLPRANAIIWDSITISGTLGVLASGVQSNGQNHGSAQS